MNIQADHFVENQYHVLQILREAVQVIPYNEDNKVLVDHVLFLMAQISYDLCLNHHDETLHLIKDDIPGDRDEFKKHMNILMGKGMYPETVKWK